MSLILGYLKLLMLMMSGTFIMFGIFLYISWPILAALVIIFVFIKLRKIF